MISVCMTIHNGAAFLQPQMESILAQLGTSDELVVSDDGSSDESLKILESFDVPQVKILPQKKFGSPIKNFEYALTHCRHEIIFLADQDDVWHPQKVKLMSKALVQCDLVVCDCRVVDKDLNVIHPSFFKVNRAKEGLMRNLVKNSFVGCCMAFRKEVLKKAIPFPPKIEMHDQWIGLVAQKYFQVKFMPQVLVDYRRHDQNFSSTGSKSAYSLEKKIFSRYQLAKVLLQR
jgi:glycosyltransferase involved in cell wall biosynthesis